MNKEIGSQSAVYLCIVLGFSGEKKKINDTRNNTAYIHSSVLLLDIYNFFSESHYYRVHNTIEKNLFYLIDTIIPQPNGRTR